MRNRTCEERSRSLDVMRGTAIPDSEIFQFTPLSYASEALFCDSYRNIFQKKVMREFNRRVAKRFIHGGRLCSYLITPRFPARAYYFGKKGKEVIVAMMISPGQIRMMTLSTYIHTYHMILTLMTTFGMGSHK